MNTISATRRPISRSPSTTINTEPKFFNDIIPLRLFLYHQFRFKFNAIWWNIYFNIALLKTQISNQKLFQYHHHLWQIVSVQPEKNHFDASKEKEREDWIDLKQITISNYSLDIHQLLLYWGYVSPRWRPRWHKIIWSFLVNVRPVTSLLLSMDFSSNCRFLFMETISL